MVLYFCFTLISTNKFGFDLFYVVILKSFLYKIYFNLLNNSENKKDIILRKINSIVTFLQKIISICKNIYELKIQLFNN
jgi:hypothetical protein